MTLHYTSGLWALLFSCVVATSTAQVQLGISVGGAGYEGDLSPDSRLEALGQMGSSFGVFGRVVATPNISLKAYVQSSRIQGTDAGQPGRENRNLSFRSDIFEFGVAAEYYPFGRNLPVVPYTSIGLSAFHFNPETDYRGRWVELQPLGTEGQGLPGYAPKYALTRFAVPIGMGVQRAFGSSFVLGLEAHLRMTFFDHLDDVSGNYVNYFTLLDGRDLDGSGGNGTLAATLADRTGEVMNTDPRDLPSGTARGNPLNNDWYYTATVSLSYRIGSGLFGSGADRRNASRYNKCFSF